MSDQYTIFQENHDARSAISDVQFKGISIPFSEMHFAEANQIARRQLIIKELELSKHILNMALNLHKEVLKSGAEGEISIYSQSGSMLYSLFTQAVVCYAKCFNSASSRRVKLEAAAVFSGQSVFLESHEKFKNIRDNYSSHGGDTEFEGAHSVACFNPMTDGHPLRVLVIARFRVPSLELFIELYDLVSFVKDREEAIQTKRVNQFTQKITKDPDSYGLEPEKFILNLDDNRD